MSSQNDNTSLPAEAISTQPFTPQPDSRLLHKLPGELRNRIYRLGLLSDTAVVVEVKDLTVEDGKDGRNTTTTATTNAVPSLQPTHRLALVPPLLLTCKQTRHEASEIHYLENTFALSTSIFEHPSALLHLTQILRPWASQITALRIQHTFAIGSPKSPGCIPFASTNFTISRETGRLQINHAMALWYEGDPALYRPILPQEAQVGYLNPVPGPLGIVCTCPILRFAKAHPGDDVVRFVLRYAEMLPGGKVGWKGIGGVFFHCWTCAGDEVF